MKKILLLLTGLILTESTYANSEKYKDLSESDFIKEYISSNTSERLFLGNPKTTITEGVTRHRIAQGGYFSGSLSSSSVVSMFKAWCTKNNGSYTIFPSEKASAYLRGFDKSIDAHLSGSLNGSMFGGSFMGTSCLANNKKYSWLIQDGKKEHTSPESYIYVIAENTLPLIEKKGEEALLAKNQQLESRKKCEANERATVLSAITEGKRLYNGELVISVKKSVIEVQEASGKTRWQPIDELENRDLFGSRVCNTK
jgi:hypothetical protein